MVILKADNDYNGFQWSILGIPLAVRQDNNTEHYSYNEREDYKPVTVELDSGDHPQEIGTFVGDSCIGATALNADDTMAVIRAYVNPGGNDTITFQKYYGTKSSRKYQINEYYVYNNRNKLWKKGVAVNSRDKDRFFVSFKKKKQINPENTSGNIDFILYPNPAQNSVAIEYNLEDKGNVTLTLYDVAGRVVLQQTVQQQAGTHQQQLNTRKLQNGLYLLRLSTPWQTGVKRLIIKR